MQLATSKGDRGRLLPEFGRQDPRMKYTLQSMGATTSTGSSRIREDEESGDNS
jgi:hypothetical protein